MSRNSIYGPDNPHPLSRLKTELVWEGKYDEYGNPRPIKLPASPLPLQRIETIDEPRDRSKAQGLLWKPESAHRDDFRNLLIWGDNKLAMAALLERFRGQVDLIYIDPPFDVGADFTMQVQIGEEGEEVLKEQSILEAVAYRDTWGKGTDSYIHMMYERLILMRDLLSESGSIYLHCDWRVASMLRLLLDEIFGNENFRNEIIWHYRRWTAQSGSFQKMHDTLLWFTKTSNYKLNKIHIEPTEGQKAKHEKGWDRNSVMIDGRRQPQLIVYNQAKVDQAVKNGRINISEFARIVKVDIGMTVAPDVWEINYINSQAFERTGFNTQKPEALLERVMLASSNEADLIADFFCGSGTTMAVAEKLGRRWIGVDLGRYGVHVARKRLIQGQRELHAVSRPYRSFDVYNLGRYERQWWQMERLKGADEEHRRIVLQFYKAAVLEHPPNPFLHGKKHGAFVHVDQIDSVFAFPELRVAAEAAQAAGGRELHCLAWEFEMELALKKQAIEAETGLTIRLKYIPREIMEPNRTECQFFEAGYLEAKALMKGKKIDVVLTRFTPALAEAPEAEMAELRERAVTSPFDFIDFWAVDFEWRDGKPFEHHWQDFRTRKDRSLKTRSDLGWEYTLKGTHQICVKVIDVFGVDTTTVIQVEV